MFKSKIKKEDQVVVISGSDKGKRGKVLLVNEKKGLVLVEGMNKKTKNLKQNQAPDGQGGIITLEFPFKLSKVMYFCDKCKKGVRLGKDENKNRVCKKCGKSVN